MVVAGGAARAALAALTRPSGLLLALPAAVEAVSDRRVRLRAAEPWPVELAAVLGPVAGIVAVPRLGRGDVPATSSRRSACRTTSAVASCSRRCDSSRASGSWWPTRSATALHVPVRVRRRSASLWVCWRRLPASWAVLATASVLINLAADNLNSTERYAYGTVPLAGGARGGRRGPVVATDHRRVVGRLRRHDHPRLVRQPGAVGTTVVCEARPVGDAVGLVEVVDALRVAHHAGALGARDAAIAPCDSRGRRRRGGRPGRLTGRARPATEQRRRIASSRWTRGDLARRGWSSTHPTCSACATTLTGFDDARGDERAHRTHAPRSSRRAHRPQPRRVRGPAFRRSARRR